ncbi:MAG: diaminopimelate decarboxylase [Synergistaceae bacterium]|nr:diaminopimelate decarboxylase [Synergistaceae bacterium]
MFLKNEEAFEIVREFGSPVYVYSEDILRQRCRELLDAFDGRLSQSFSVKANSNLSLLRIIREEGIGVDAMSHGEIFLLEHAGFSGDEIFYIGNNVSADELRYCIDRGILVSADSLSQLESLGRINRGGRVALRFNPCVGAGHCEKVVTAGHKTKFGIDPRFCAQAKELLAKYDMKLVGINQHIGSLFLEPEPYVEAAKNLLAMVLENFPGLDFIDFGGGFGVHYRPDEKRLDFAALRGQLFPVLDSFVESYDNKYVHFKCEPGRYLVAECGLLLGTVHAVKENYGETYVGTDIGFNVLMRPVLYDSYHEVNLLKGGGEHDGGSEREASPVTVVGNICESGDILGAERRLDGVRENDLIAVENAGAYGYSMASNYNCRLRPAEVLKTSQGEIKLIRAADTLESLIENF